MLIEEKKMSTGIFRSDVELHTFSSDPITLAPEPRHFVSADKDAYKFCLLVVALGKATSLLDALPIGSPIFLGCVKQG